MFMCQLVIKFQYFHVIYHMNLSMLCQLVHQSRVETQIECIFGCGKGCIPNIIRILLIYLAGEAIKI